MDVLLFCLPRRTRTGRARLLRFVALNPPRDGEELLLLRIGGLVEFAFADDRVVRRLDLVTPLDLDLFLVALVDLRDADDMLVLRHSEDRHALGVAAHHPD